MGSLLVVVVLGLVLTFVECKPGAEAKIVSYSSDITENGYGFKYETSDGIKREEIGSYQPTGEKESILKVNGKFEFPFPDGYQMVVVFVSDENGYRPKFSIIAPKQDDKKKGTTITFDNRINVVEKSITSTAIASLAGGGLG